MENNNRFIAVIVFLVFSFSGQAQTNPYILYLKDKQGTAYTLSDPYAYLSPKSLQRRINQNLSIDSTDLPVSEQYQNEIRSFGATIIYTSRWLNAVYIQADAGQYAQIKNLPFVQSGIQSFRTQDQVNTHQTESVFSTSYSDSFSDFLGITEMHRQHLTGEGVLIAITDSGFPGSDTLTAFKHLWNQNKVVYHWDVADNNANVFNDDTHGTFVFSILAAQLPDYTGVAPDADYILLRTEVESSETKMEEFHWLRAAEIADSCGADIISCSLGYTTYDNTSESYSYADMDGATSIIALAANKAFAKGILVVCSAGNEGDKPWKYIDTPADAKHVLTVGSVNFDRSKSGFSSVGPTADGRIKPDLCATGSGIYGLNPSGSLLSRGGTSFSTPMVAGMAAGLKQAFPALTSQELKDILIQSGDRYTHPDNNTGYGILHYQKIASIAGLYENENALILAPNPYYSGDLFLKLALPNTSITITVTDVQGGIVYTYSLRSPEEIIQLDDNFEMLTAGVYFFTVQTDMKKQVIKWIKL